MITLKAIQTSFTPSHNHFHDKKSFKKRKQQFISLCKSNGSDDKDENVSQPAAEGDNQKQDLLAKIAMLQARKVRLTDYLDERSEYLTQFAEEANAEFDQIGENTLKELDEAGARIMENIESRMQAFEESVGMNKQEIEENEKIVSDFEDQIDKEMNEGLFFKNLSQKPSSLDKPKAIEETKNTSKNDGSVIRRNVYLVLIGLVAIGITDASISSIIEWRKIAVFGLIIVGLVFQLIYEQSLLSEQEKKSK